jgi:hypothetical protein
LIIKSLKKVRSFSLILCLDFEINGYLNTFGASITNKVDFNGISSSQCHQLAGSDEKGNLYQTRTVSCQTPAPTICRKNIGNYQLPGRI